MRRYLLTALVLGVSAVMAFHANANDTGMAASHSWHVERNKTCLEEHTHTGGADGRTKAAAKKAAIHEWRAFTAWEYGSAWASFRRAASKVVSFTKAEKGWSARVEARPCRLNKRRKARTARRRSAYLKKPRNVAARNVRQARQTRSARGCSRSTKKPSYWC